MMANFQGFLVILFAVSATAAILGLVLPVGAATITLSVDGNIQNWTLIPGSTNENSTAVTLNVSCDSSSWTVSVVDNLDDDKPAAGAGRMAEYNTTTGYVNSGSILGANLTVEGGSAVNMTNTTATLGPTDQVIETGNNIVTNVQVPVAMSQQVATTDLHLTNGDEYRVVITFVGGTS